MPEDIVAVPTIEESQEMRTATYLRRVTNTEHLVGLPCAKLEIYCLQKIVESVVYCDSLVFQCAMKSCDLTRTVLHPDILTGGDTMHMNTTCFDLAECDVYNM